MTVTQRIIRQRLNGTYTAGNDERGNDNLIKLDIGKKKIAQAVQFRTSYILFKCLI
jgi:hypothetical protein